MYWSLTLLDMKLWIIAEEYLDNSKTPSTSLGMFINRNTSTVITTILVRWTSFLWIGENPEQDILGNYYFFILYLLLYLWHILQLRLMSMTAWAIPVVVTGWNSWNRRRNLKEEDWVGCAAVSLLTSGRWYSAGGWAQGRIQIWIWKSQQIQ